MSKEKILSEEMLDAAVGVLGAMLIDKEAVGPMLMKLDDADFLDGNYRLIFQAFRQRYNAGEPVDPLLINQTLGGGYSKLLSQIMEVTPTAANADAYADALKQASRLYRLRQLGTALSEAKDEDKCRELIDQANLLFSQHTGIKRVSLAQSVQDFFQRHSRTSPPDSLKWFLSSLNDFIHVGPGDMVVIGGYPSAGKTAFALQTAFHIAKTKRVGFFSYETDSGKLSDRTIACQSQASFHRMMSGKLEDEDYQRVRESMEYLCQPAMDFLEASGMTVDGIGSYAMAYHYDVIVVDYLQKLPAQRGSKNLSETERVSQISNDLQQMGRRTGKTVIALSQLSRADKKGGDAPTMSDLRYSGQIEQDADLILLLWKERPNDAFSRRCLRVAKNKDGESGLNLLLNFDGTTQRFTKAVTQPMPTPKPSPDPQCTMFRPDNSGGPSPWG